MLCRQDGWLRLQNNKKYIMLDCHAELPAYFTYNWRSLLCRCLGHLGPCGGLGMGGLPLGWHLLSLSWFVLLWDECSWSAWQTENKAYNSSQMQGWSRFIHGELGHSLTVVGWEVFCLSLFTRRKLWRTECGYEGVVERGEREIEREKHSEYRDKPLCAVFGFDCVDVCVRVCMCVKWTENKERQWNVCEDQKNWKRKANGGNQHNDKYERWVRCRIKLAAESKRSLFGGVTCPGSDQGRLLVAEREWVREWVSARCGTHKRDRPDHEKMHLVFTRQTWNITITRVSKPTRHLSLSSWMALTWMVECKRRGISKRAS